MADRALDKIVWDGDTNWMDLTDLIVGEGSEDWNVEAGTDDWESGSGSDDYNVDATEGDISIFIACAPNVDNSTNESFLEAGSLGIKHLTSTSGQTGYIYNPGTEEDVAAAQSDFQVLEFAMTSDGKIYRDNVLLGTNTYSQRQIEGPVGLGSNKDGSANFFNGDIFEILIYSTDMADLMRPLAVDYLETKWNQPVTEYIIVDGDFVYVDGVPQLVLQ